MLLDNKVVPSGYVSMCNPAEEFQSNPDSVSISMQSNIETKLAKENFLVQFADLEIDENT